MDRHIKLVRNRYSRFLVILCNVEIRMIAFLKIRSQEAGFLFFFLIVERKSHSEKGILFPDVMGVTDDGSQTVFQVQFCCMSLQ